MKHDLYTVAVITGAIISGFAAASACVLGAIVMLRARRLPNRRRPWSAQRRFRLRHTFTALVGVLLVVNAFTEANRPLPPLMDMGKASVTMTESIDQSIVLVAASARTRYATDPYRQHLAGDDWQLRCIRDGETIGGKRSNFNDRWEWFVCSASGTYCGAFQMSRSTHASVSNARQEALWGPDMPIEEQIRSARRLRETTGGVHRWPPASRYCR